MKKEDLKVGGIYKEPKYYDPSIRKVVFFDDKAVFYYFGNNMDSLNSKRLHSTMEINCFLSCNEEIKEKKRYWIFDVKIPNGLIIKPHFYMDEDGIGTNGELCYNKHNLIKKHENEFVEA